jgi:(E)-4-hydroxy-3-methylbut-2-enyl-diphosphate synthase
LKGDNIAGEFRQIVDEYVQMKYPKKTVDVQ